jgi:pSer/pThr/pTyr-binding forkhead associated (FHA) protein
MRKCGKCGARNDEAALICSLCSERLGVATQADSYEPRLMVGGRQTFRGKTGGDPNATRDEPPPALGRTIDKSSGQHRLPNLAGPKHYLLPPVGEPVLLDISKGSIVFGRDETCDIPITSTKASRRHAELIFQKGGVLLRDLNSQNGTYLNDEKILAERPVTDGDSLRMGEFAATYRLLQEGEDPHSLRFNANETAIMEAVPLAAGEPAGALTGDMSILPVGEVLRRLTSLRAHGELTVDVNGTKGTIKIIEGMPVEGSYAGLEGAPAITAMASLTKGHFAFVPDPNRPAPTAKPAAAVPTGTPQRPPAPRPAPGVAPKPAAPPGAPPAARRPAPPPG